MDDKVGDFVLELNPRDTGGRDRRIVFEAKDRRLSMEKTLVELDAAMLDRDAQVGVLVFAKATQDSQRLAQWRLSALSPSAPNATTSRSTVECSLSAGRSSSTPSSEPAPSSAASAQRDSGWMPLRMPTTI